MSLFSDDAPVKVEEADADDLYPQVDPDEEEEVSPEMRMEDEKAKQSS